MSDALKYPIGRWTRPATLTDQQQQEAIDRLRAQPEALRRAIAGWNDSMLDTPYREGGWTVRQVVHHLADSHMNMYIRVRLALTEENPTIKPYDEGAWSTLADVTAVSPDVSVSLLDGLHVRMLALLDATAPADRRRVLMHPENGPMTIEQLMSLYAWHGEHHIAHITSLRERMGWR